MTSIAIIPARGGSKRIPRKNIKEFCGKPIIEYSIRAALNCGLFDEVMVSTDDEEIAAVAEAAGASVPFFRSSENSNDRATSIDALLEVLCCYERQGAQFDFGCLLYPTAPFVTAQKLQRAMQQLQESDADSLITVTPFSFPPQRGFHIDDGKVLWTQPEHMFTRTQDLPTIYHDCGQFYCFRMAPFMSKKMLVTEHTIPFIIDETEMQDIDTATDWAIAEMKYRLTMETVK